MLRKKFVEAIKTHIFVSITFFFENRTVYEIMWKNTVQPYEPHMTIWRMHIARWITKATYTHTHSEYVILIAFSTATLVARSHLNVTLYVHCLSC